VAAHGGYKSPASCPQPWADEGCKPPDAKESAGPNSMPTLCIMNIGLKPVGVEYLVSGGESDETAIEVLAYLKIYPKTLYIYRVILLLSSLCTIVYTCTPFSSPYWNCR